MARSLNHGFSLFDVSGGPDAKHRYGPVGKEQAEEAVRGLLGLDGVPRDLQLIRASNVFGAQPVRATPQAPVVKHNAPLRVPQTVPASAPIETDGLPPGVDWDFIGLREGEGTKASVPRDKKGRPFDNSGVTVAHGFDLGAQDLRELAAFGIPPDLTTRFTPYLGVRRQAAIDLLNEKPLAITDAEQTLVDQKVRTRAYLDTAANFNKSATGGVKFEDLPEEAKTVLVDLWFQYPHPATSIPKFWGHATSGRWRDAQRELNNFGDHYGPRRSEEAEHLNSAIQNGKLK